MMGHKSFIGVDIGTSQIKSAEVQINDQGFEILSLQECPTPTGSDDEMILALKKMIPGARQVITCAGGGDVVCRIVRFPRLKEKELEAAVRYEVESFLSSPEKMIIRYVPLQPGQGQELLLLAVQKETVYRYYKIFSMAGLMLTAVDLPAFALWRLFGRKTRDSRVIIDLGAKFTTIVLVNKGVIRLIRTLSAGGEDIENSAALSGTMELFKNALASEIRRSLIYYSNQENVSVEKVILTGGTSKLAGISNYLQDVIDVPVARGMISDLQRREIDPTFAVAVGLALREVIK